MRFEYSPYILPLLAAACASLAVIIYAWTRRTVNGARELLILSLALFAWLVSSALEIAGADRETKYLWGVIMYLGIAFVPYSWLLFAIAYSKPERGLSRRFLALVALIPAITVILALTTQWHGLIWNGYTIGQYGGFSTLVVSHGPWFFVHIAYSYLLMVGGTFLLLRVFWQRQSALYRGQVVPVLIGVLAPWIGNVLYLTGRGPIPYLDLTPFAFTISAIAGAWAIFGFRLVDITPLARERVIDSMREGMIVLDVRGNVVDINTAAARMIGIPVTNAIGRAGQDVFSPWPHLVAHYQDTLSASDEITVGEGAAKRSYEVHLSPLLDKQEQLAGRVVLLRALDAEELPRPRFAAEAMLPVSSSQPDGRTRKRGWLAEFFSVPEQTNLKELPGFNPNWYRMFERNFTVALRIGTLLFMARAFVTLRSSPPTLRASYLVLGLGLGILAWVRQIPFRTRAAVTIFLIYLAGLAEIIGLGKFAEGLFFLLLTVPGTVLALGTTAGLLALFINLFTAFGVGLSISQGYFAPPVSGANAALYASMSEGFLSTFVLYAGAASGMYFMLSTALNNLNRAWHLEAQARNLLQQERDLLESRVEERTRELSQANLQLQAQNEELEAFAHTVAHDLKTPLTGLVGYSTLLLAPIMNWKPERVKEYAARIARSANMMTSIVDELLLLASVRQMNQLEIGPMDMAAVVRGALERFGESVEELQAEMHVPETWPTVQGYAPWIEEVWFNYISNALKYGGTPPRVELGYEELPEHVVRFWVKDNGYGLTEEQCAQLFTEFTRLHKVRAEGHGLGLSIVQRIMTRLGGEVDVESTVGEGSTFWFTLPANNSHELLAD